jgi:NitT/TauT family transport system substrate-binding protein
MRFISTGLAAIGCRKLDMPMRAAVKAGGDGRILACVAMVLAMAVAGFGCDSKKDGAQSSAAGAPGLTKIQVGYVGLTCEAALFVAQEKGFFKEEGLDAEFTRYDWATYRDAIALGKVDITYHLLMFLLKPIEQGADLKITAGVHKGCLRVQTSISGGIHAIADLKGKRIGVPGLGTPPFVFATRVLANNGIDPARDITWRVFPASELGLALQMGEVDAVGSGEPVGTLLESQGKVRDIFANATTPPYNDEYCCVVVCNGKFVSQHPGLAAGATRAILKASKWVQANPVIAAQISVDGKFVAVNVDLDALALSKLQYVPSVSGGRKAVMLAAAEMKKAGMLDPSTDVDALAARAFQQLDGVSDEIVAKVTVDKVPGGRALPALKFDATMLAEGEAASCCTVARAK